MYGFTIVPFSVASSNQKQIDAWYALRSSLRKETLPDESVLTMEILLAHNRAMQELLESVEWCIWHGEDEVMVGLAGVHFSKEGSESDPAYFTIQIDQNYRRSGIGSTFLRKIVQTATERERKILRVQTNDRCLPGEKFIAPTGAETVHKGHFNILVLKDVEETLINSWLGLPMQGFNEVTIGNWEGLTPEHRIQEISDFYQVIYDAGKEQHGDSGYKFTPENVRKGENVSISMGKKVHAIYGADAESDRLLGLTKISWFSSRPSVVLQGYTAVLPDARGKGIGRRLKAEMLKKVIRDMPEVEYVKTGNADNNDAILKINAELGFIQQMATKTWQIETAALEEYLSVL
ncbi:MAG: GNAT family N-acetyltransferase [Candidatus Aegiribacteria sp.]|nr:GNAT family N-acetyltransferase [Candidatus Aegiribacteria sp.]